MAQLRQYFKGWEQRTGVGQTAAIDTSSDTRWRGLDTVTVQIDIAGGSGATRVTVQGRLDPSMDWVNLTGAVAIAASTILQVARCGELRLDVTAMTGGTVDGGVLL